MSFLWFLVALTFFVLWLWARSNQQSEQSDDYGQGYWDGYRALGDKLTALRRTGTLDQQQVQRLIDEGNGGAPSDESTAPREELGVIAEDTSDMDEPTEPSYQPHTVAPQPVLSAEQLAEAKEAQTMKNLNILLYAGSFLIVAAAALFVTLVMPAGIKLGSLIIVTLAFYLTGLVLHAHSGRLRPAAVAFVGTGLAILPFIGFALTLLGGMSAQAAWLVISCVGLVAYAVAAVRLRSELVSYLTMAFVLSLALSAVSTLSLSIIWYFIASIGVSLICNSLHVLWPNLLPKIFAKPVEQTGQLTTPVALVASLLVASRMDLFMYEVLYGIATAHYLVVWLEKRTLLYEAVVRVLAHVTLLIVAVDVSQIMTSTLEASRVMFGGWMLALAALQAAYSLLRVQRHNPTSRQFEQWFLVATLWLMTIGMAWWFNTAQASWWTALSLMTIGLTALGGMWRLGQAGWGYVGLIASSLLPYVIGRGALTPPISYEVIAGGFVIAALGALMGLERLRALGKSHQLQDVLTVAVAVYALLVTISGYLSGVDVTIGWTTLLTGALFVLLSYLIRASVLELVGMVAGVASVAAWVDNSPIDLAWRWCSIAVVSAALALVAAAIHQTRGERERRNIVVAFGAVMLATLVGVTGGDEIVVRTAIVLLLSGAAAAMILRFMLAGHTSRLVQISQLSYGGLAAMALIVATSAGMGWLTLVLAVLTILLWLCSYVEKLPLVLAAGNLALVAMLASLWWWLEFDQDWLITGVAWLSAAVFYATYWLMVERHDRERQWISLGSVWVVLGAVVMVYLFSMSDAWVMVASGSLIVGALTLALQGYLDRKQDYIEGAAYIATVGLQRIVSVLLPETNLVVYGHWWALVIGLMAWWRAGHARVRAMVALGFVTASTGIYALMGMPGYPLVFLIEHVAILTIGAVMRQQWALWWGLIAVVVAVLYFLRGYTFLALLFIGFLLILFVIWRLGKMGKK